MEKDDNKSTREEGFGEKNIIAQRTYPNQVGTCAKANHRLPKNPKKRNVGDEPTLTIIEKQLKQEIRKNKIAPLREHWLYNTKTTTQGSINLRADLPNKITEIDQISQKPVVPTLPPKKNKKCQQSAL